MPLTKFQEEIIKIISRNRTAGSHLAGGAALHLAPNSFRYSNDLDYFHDTIELVNKCFEDDVLNLRHSNVIVKELLRMEGFIRCELERNEDRTKIEWVHDSAWRFIPPVYLPEYGYILHPIDNAINKVLALAGREEPRDFLDTLFIHSNILPLKALIWAAVGKDPGFSPQSLLELIKRRGKYRAEDFDRLMLIKKIDLVDLKSNWLKALEEVGDFFNNRDPSNVGSLYYSLRDNSFIAPSCPDKELTEDIVIHRGCLGGRPLPT